MKKSLKEKAKMVQCPFCKGFGTTLPQPFIKKCSFCDGHGRLEMVRLEDAQQEVDKYKTFRDNAFQKLCDAQEEIEELKQKLSSVFEMLSEIEEKRGPYSQNALTHAENVINNSSENAKKIRLILKGLLV